MDIPDEINIMLRVIRCILSAQIRPSTTTRSHRGIWAILALNRAARRRATFSAGVSDGGGGEDGLEEEALG